MPPYSAKYGGPIGPQMHASWAGSNQGLLVGGVLVIIETRGHYAVNSTGQALQMCRVAEVSTWVSAQPP